MTAEPTGKKRGYHHGNLRPALIQAAIELIDELGIGALTLRELASRVGVTHAAPYRHFRDKSALLRAVAQESFHALSTQLDAAVAEPLAPSTAPAAALRRVAHAYLAFATRRPALYRLMFASEADLGGPVDEPRRAVLAPLERAVGHTNPASSAPPGTNPPRRSAVVLWGTLHGLASLHVHQHLPMPSKTGAAELSDLVDAAVTLLEQGLRGPAAP